VVKPLSTGDKGETPEFLSAQEITLSAPLSIAECRFKDGEFSPRSAALSLSKWARRTRRNNRWECFLILFEGAFKT